MLTDYREKLEKWPEKIIHPRHPVYLVYKPMNVDQLRRKARKLVTKKFCNLGILYIQYMNQ